MSQEQQQAREEAEARRPQPAASEREPAPSRPLPEATQRALDDATEDMVGERPRGDRPRPAPRQAPRPQRRARRDSGGFFGALSSAGDWISDRASDARDAVVEHASEARAAVGSALLGDEPEQQPELPAAGETGEDGRPARIEFEEEGGGLLGRVASGVRDLGDGAAELLQNETVSTVIDTLGHDGRMFSADELGEELQDLSRGVADHVDEDLRDSVAMVTDRQTATPYADREFRLEDQRAQRDVERRTRMLFDGADGAGTDPAQIREALRGADPDTIHAMRAEYARTHRGRDMLRDIDRELSGADEDEIEGMLTGDPVEQALAQIDNATHGVDTDEGTLEAAIRNCPEERRGEVIEAMGGGDEMRERLGREAPLGDGRVAVALLENREADAVAYRLDDELNNGVLDVVGRELGIRDLGSPNRDEVYRILENVPDDQREAVLHSYANMRHGRSSDDRDGHHETLEDALTRELDHGAERERALALASGNRALADAHALQMAADEPWYESEAVIGAALLVTPLAPVVGAGLLLHAAANEFSNGAVDLDATDTDALQGVLERRPGEEDEDYDRRIEATEREYNRVHGGGDDGAFDQMLADELGEGSLDHQRATSTIANHGEMDWRTQLEYATERGLWSTDEQMTIRALEQARESGAFDGPPTERYRLMSRLVDGANPELDGRWALQARELLETQPRTPQEWLHRYERRHELDRDTLGAGIVDMHSTSGGDYDAHLDEMRGLIDEHGDIRPGQKQRFFELQRILDGDQGSYRTRQDETTDVAVEVAATTAAITAATAVTVLSGGTAAPAVLAMAGAAGGGLGGMGARAAMLGDAYEREDVAQDGVRTVVSTAGAGATQVLQGPATNILMRAAAAAPAAELEMATDLAMDEEHDLDVEDIEQRGVVAAGQVVGSAAGETVENAAVGSNPSLGRRMAGQALGGVTEGGISSGANPATWRDGVGTGLRRVGGNALRGGAVAAAQAVGEHRHDQHQRRAGGPPDGPPPDHQPPSSGGPPPVYGPVEIRPTIPVGGVETRPTIPVGGVETRPTIPVGGVETRPIVPVPDAVPTVGELATMPRGGEPPRPAPAPAAADGEHGSDPDQIHAWARGHDARQLLDQQAAEGGEVAVSVPVAEDGTLSDSQVTTVGTREEGWVPPGNMPVAHTHPGASDSPINQLPGPADAGSARNRRNTQAVVHDEGVAVFDPDTVVVDAEGDVGDQRDVVVRRRATGVTQVESTQVVVHHDDDGNVVLWPSPDNPEPGVLPISRHDEEPVYLPGTSDANIDTRQARREAALPSSQVPDPVDPRPVIGYDRAGNELHEIPAEGVWFDLEGRPQSSRRE